MLVKKLILIINFLLMKDSFFELLFQKKNLYFQINQNLLKHHLIFLLFLHLIMFYYLLLIELKLISIYL